MATVTCHPTVSDLIVWPDDTYCDRDEFNYERDYSHMSDDFTVLAEGTIPWFDFIIKHNLFTEEPAQ